MMLSLFCGAGGMSAGFIAAGIPSSSAVDMNSDAAATFRRNNGSASVLDISTDTERIIREAGNPFIITGGPPCQGFSSAGRRIPDDPRSALVMGYLTILSRLRPSWFFFENVEGILTTDAGAVLFSLLKGLRECGYTFGLQRINCAAYGLPQARRRVIIMGNRHGLPFGFPEPDYGFISLRGSSLKVPYAPGVENALSGLSSECLAGGIYEYTEAPVSEYDALMRRNRSTDIHITTRHPPRFSELLLPGMSMKNLPEACFSPGWSARANRRVSDGTASSNRGGAPNGVVRLHPRRVSLTITGGSSGELMHPEHNRFLSLRECARLQGFHDGYAFTGNARSIARQIGNAFPPSVARKFADKILEEHGRAGTGNIGNVKPGLLFHNIGSSGSAAHGLTNTRLSEMVEG